MMPQTGNDPRVGHDGAGRGSRESTAQDTDGDGLRHLHCDCGACVDDTGCAAESVCDTACCGEAARCLVGASVVPGTESSATRDSAR
ncbi:MAG: hypothetical protein AAF799_14190 [Myxococcota bacterium]